MKSFILFIVASIPLFVSNVNGQSCRVRFVSNGYSTRLPENQRLQIGAEVEAGVRIMVTCFQGYQVQGSDSLSCLSSGNWNRDFPTCVDASEANSDSCIVPFTNNGNFLVNGRTVSQGTAIPVGLGIVLQCDFGYKTSSANPNSYCIANGFWQPNPGQCIPTATTTTTTTIQPTNSFAAFTQSTNNRNLADPPTTTPKRDGKSN